MVRESNDETVFAGTGELSALDRESGEPLAHADDERSDGAVAIANAADAQLEVRADSLAAVSGTFARNQSPPPSAGTHWRVALVVGTGLGAALSALSYSQRSVNLAREAPVTSAARPAAREHGAPAPTLGRPADDQHAAESPPSEAAPLAQPSTIATVQTEAALQASLATQPSAAEIAQGVATESNVAAQPSAAEVAVAIREPDVAAQPAAAREQTASSGPAIANAARSNPPSARPTPATPKPDKPAAPANSAERAVKTENAPETTAAPDSEEARLAAAAVRTGSDSPMDSMIDAAFTQAQALADQRRAALAAAAAVPAVPARGDVIHAMRELLPALRECAQGQTGLASADLMVSNDGSVQLVGLTGHAFGGTPSGRCMEGVLMRAHFPRFRQPSFRMQFPFLLE
jgi:hypothetical protein